MGRVISRAMESLQTNPELELAFEYLSQTRRHVFLTGKAGTGKTTLLQRVRSEIPKRMAVVAPTGVAAINAKGVTIHSLFQLPFGVLPPQRIRDEMLKRRFSARKVNLLVSLDLLIIDEISMVRADVLDAIDAVLQRYRRSREPFGGLQLLMIGDLHQLPPVVRPDDWEQLSLHYRTSYFFGSSALQKARPVNIELRHIYRQSDADFIDLLNHVRNNHMSEIVLEKLNARYQPEFKSENQADHYITLTSHNAAANQINAEQLDKLNGKSHTFSAEINGEFPPSMYPNDPHLSFKIGAQVMFNRNDSYPERAYYNGKIGVITEIEGRDITVACPGETPLKVGPVCWDNRKFELNPTTKEIDEKIVGTYEQHPLKLAWAITIHKSQGLTFERVIIDAGAAFAHGQVYVALSRCKSFGGIILRTPIGTTSVRTDSVVADYSAKAADNPPGAKELNADKQDFQASCLRQLFDFSGSVDTSTYLHRTLLENEGSVQANGITAFNQLLRILDDDIVTVGKRFLPQLEHYLQQTELPAENEALLSRLDGAAPYFIGKLKNDLLPALKSFQLLTDNQGLREQFEKRLQTLRRQLFVKRRLFEALEKGFEPLTFLKAKADAETDFVRMGGKISGQRLVIPKDLANRELYKQLVRWRLATSKELEQTPYQVASNNSLLAITEILPTNRKSLLAVPKFGKKRFAQHGAAILEIVNAYLAEHPQTSDLLKAKPGKPKTTKLDTKFQSLQLYQSGKTVEEIANLRQLKPSTIMSHLVAWVQLGEVAITELVDAQALAEITQQVRKDPAMSVGDLHKLFDGRFDYAILRMVQRREVEG